MRVLFGIILGVALTVGVAFVSDTWTTGPAAPSSTAADASSPPSGRRNMVNWDVVGDNLRIVRQHVRNAWTSLSHKVSS